MINKFEEIPEYIEKSFEKYQNVVLFFCDALGWKFFKKGHKIISQLPSTTVVHVTSILTGKPLAEHAMPEWEYYDKEADNLIKPLYFSYAKDRTRNTLKIKPEKIFEKGQWATKMRKNGIVPWIIQNKDYCFSYFTNIVGYDFNKVPIENELLVGFESVNKILKENTSNKNYIYFYYDKLDTALHRYGCKSREVKNEIKLIKKSLKMFLEQNLGYRKNTLFILIADHGHIDVDKTKTFYINIKIPEIVDMVQKNNEGKKIFIGGSCRGAFLYIKPQYLNEALKILKDKLKDIAEVYKSGDIIKLNKHTERIGNIYIRPYGNNTVWWYEKDCYEVIHKSYHGGCSKDEREIPFLTQELK